MAIGSKIRQIRKEDESWVIQVEPIPYSLNVKVWLLQKYPSGDIYNCNIDKGIMVMRKVENEVKDAPKPLMEVPERAWGLIVDAITESLGDKPKVVTASELEATKYHLEDMRKIVFKNDKQ